MALQGPRLLTSICGLGPACVAQPAWLVSGSLDSVSCYVTQSSLTCNKEPFPAVPWTSPQPPNHGFSVSELEQQATGLGLTLMLLRERGAAMVSGGSGGHTAECDAFLRR